METTLKRKDNFNDEDMFYEDNQSSVLYRTGGYKNGLFNIANCKANMEVEGCLLIKEVTHSVTVTKKPFTKVIMTDGMGDMVAFIWDKEVVFEGNCISFKAKTKLYQDKINMELIEYETEEVAEHNLPSKVDIKKIREELLRYRGVSDSDFRLILNELIFGDESPSNSFFLAPAATHNHHNYRFGLAEHTLEVVKTAHALAHTNGLNIDLTVTGALLHDIGKTKVYGMDSMTPTYNEYYGMREHLLIGINMIEDVVREHIPHMDKRKLELLINIIGSHHGKLEWGALFEPNHREAYAVHLADMMSSRMNVFTMLSDRSDETFVKGKVSGLPNFIVNNKHVTEVMSGKFEIISN